MKAMQPSMPQRAKQSAAARSNIDERIATASIECPRCPFVAFGMPPLLQRMSQAPHQMFRSRHSTLRVRCARFAPARFLQRRIDHSGWH
jgi:hypothetical protein